MSSPAKVTNIEALRLPLHISRDDHSQEADQARYYLHTVMSKINPAAFRAQSRRLQRIARNAFGD